MRLLRRWPLFIHPINENAMIQFALFQYIPKRKLRRASFEQQDICRMILGFKDGRNVYTRWAAHEVCRALRLMALSDTVLVCIPASTSCAHVRRWKRFAQLVCRCTGMQNGFDRLQVSGSRKRAHVSGEYELCTSIKHYVHIDADYFRGKRVLVVDDIYTTGQSSRAFIGAMQAAGADVRMALFLAKSKQFCQGR